MWRGLHASLVCSGVSHRCCGSAVGSVGIGQSDVGISRATLVCWTLNQSPKIRRDEFLLKGPIVVENEKKKKKT